jgi:hypothetical protein
MLLRLLVMVMVKNMGVLSHLVNNLLHSARLVHGLWMKGRALSSPREEHVGGKSRVSQLLLSLAVFPLEQIGDNRLGARKTG